VIGKKITIYITTDSDAAIEGFSSDLAEITEFATENPNTEIIVETESFKP
jgi:hypothetical protein